MRNKNKLRTLVGLLIEKGYKGKDYGYWKKTKNNVHWVTLFDNFQIQMYSYSKTDQELNKIYDTGMVTVTDKMLEVLIGVFIRNHD
jgi:hypothetical protein